MDLKKAVSTVEKNELFEKKGYLVHGFRSIEDGTEAPWHIGYYDPETDMITAYEVREEGVIRHEAAEVFKQEGVVPALTLDEIIIPPHDAVRAATDLLLAKHPQHPLQRVLLLTQRLPAGQVHNVTFITSTLHLFNVKIDAKEGSIVSEEFSSILSLRKE